MQCINALTFHPVHYLFQCPLANRFHNKGHHQTTLSCTPEGGGKKLLGVGKKEEEWGAKGGGWEGNEQISQSMAGGESEGIVQCSPKMSRCSVPPGFPCTDSVMYKIALDQAVAPPLLHTASNPLELTESGNGAVCLLLTSKKKGSLYTQ